MEQIEQTRLNKSDFLQMAQYHAYRDTLEVCARRNQLCFVGIMVIFHDDGSITSRSDLEIEYYYEAKPAELWDMVLKLTALSDGIRIR